MIKTNVASVLMQVGKISFEEFEAAQKINKLFDEPMVSIVKDMGLINDKDFSKLISEMSGFPLIKRSELDDIEDEVLDIMPMEYICDLEIVPYQISGNKLKIAMEDPFDKRKIKIVRFFTGMIIIPGVACKKDILSALKYYYNHSSSERPFQAMLKQVKLTDPKEDSIQKGHVIAPIEDLSEKKPVIESTSTDIDDISATTGETTTMDEDVVETEDDLLTAKDESVEEDIVEEEDDLLTAKDESTEDESAEDESAEEDIVETKDDLLDVEDDILDTEDDASASKVNDEQLDTLIEDDAPQLEPKTDKPVLEEKEEDSESVIDQSADSDTEASYEEDDIDADLLQDEENEIDLDSPEEGDLGESNISFFEDNLPKTKSDSEKPKDEVKVEAKDEAKDEVKDEVKEEVDSLDVDSEPLEGSLKTGEISFLNEPAENGEDGGKGGEDETFSNASVSDEIELLDLDLIKNKFKQCQNKKEAEKVLIEILLSDILTKDCTSDNIILLVKLKESLVGSGLNQTHPCFNELKKFKAPVLPNDVVQQAFTNGDLMELSDQKDCALLEGLKKINWSIDQPSSFWIMPFAPTGKKTLGAVIFIDPKFKPLKDNLSYFLSSITTAFADLLKVLVIASRKL